MSRFVWPIVLIATLLTCNQVAAQPVLTSTSPGAVQPGKTVELTLRGTKLDDPLQVWTSFPATIELLAGEEGKTDQTARTCKLTLAADAMLGVGGMVVGTAAGVSDVLLLMVDDLNSVADSGDNHAHESAQAIPCPVAVDGSFDGPRFDYYKLAGTAGQRLSVEVVANRIATKMDPVIRLLHADGTEILLVDDDEGLGPDCRFSHSLPADGEYLIEVRDNRYRNGGRYRLRVGDFPIVSVPYPLGGRFGSTAQFEFAGAGADGAQPVLMRIPDEVRAGELSLSAKFPDGNSSAAARFVVSSLPEEKEVEPNDERELATSVTLPCAVNGRFEHEDDRDYYRFPATEGQRLSFQAVSRSLGSPSLVTLRLYDAEGQHVAETSVDSSDEWTLDYTTPADGTYFLEVQDLLHRGGPAHVYRVAIESRPGFRLAAKAEKVNFATPVKTGAFALTVTCERRGYDGPIQLGLEDPAPGYRLFSHMIPEKGTEHRVIVGVPEQAQPGDLHVIRLVGSATINGQPYTSVVQTSAVVRTTRPQIAFPAGWLNGIVCVTTTGEAEPFYAIPTAPVQFGRQSGKADLVLTLERKNEEFKEGITLMTEGLPDGFTSEVKSENETYTLTINGPQDAALGKHTIRLISYGEFNGTGVLLVQDVPLEITDAATETEVAEK